MLRFIFPYLTTCYLVVLVGYMGCKKTEPSSKDIKNTEVYTFPVLDSINPMTIFSELPLDSAELAYKRNFVEKFYRDYWEHNKVSASILVAYKGKILFEAYRGYANKEKGDTITADTPIHLASVSKVLTGLAVMKLVESNQIDLTASVKKYLPTFPYADIRIQDLLNHRSGLPNYAYFTGDPSYWDTTKVLKNSDILEILALHKPELYNPPDRGFSYCNTNYALLALVVEKVTDAPFPFVLKKMFFEPLGMKNTTVFEMKDSNRVSQSYGFGGTKWEFNYLDAVYGDKNVYSTVRDLYRLDQALYSPRFIREDLRQKIFKGYSYESKGIKNYGLGFRMMEWPEKSLYYHNGWWHGNYTTYVRASQDSATIIALGNQQNRSIYSAFNLVSLFGNYPLELNELREENQDSLEINDSLNQMRLLELDPTARLGAPTKPTRTKPKRDSSELQIPQRKDTILRKSETRKSDSLQTKRPSKMDSLSAVKK